MASWAQGYAGLITDCPSVNPYPQWPRYYSPADVTNPTLYAVIAEILTELGSVFREDPGITWRRLTSRRNKNTFSVCVCPSSPTALRRPSPSPSSSTPASHPPPPSFPLPLRLEFFAADSHWHVGGDEPHFDCWDANPNMTAYKAQHGLSNAQLYAWFESKYAQLLVDHGKQVVGWQEIQTTAGTHPSPNTTVIEVWEGNSALAGVVYSNFDIIFDHFSRVS